MFKKIIILAIFAYLSSPFAVQARLLDFSKTADQQVEQEKAFVGAAGYDSATDKDTLLNLISTATDAFLGILGVIFIVLMVYAGYNWMTASGDQAKVDKAKDTIFRAIIGLIIVVGAYAIWNFVFVYFISK